MGQVKIYPSTQAQVQAVQNTVNEINAKLPTPTYQAKLATPSKTTQLITPDQGYDALSSVTVDAVNTLSINDFLDHGIDELVYEGEVYTNFLYNFSRPINKLVLTSTSLETATNVLDGASAVKHVEVNGAERLSNQTFNNMFLLESLNLKTVIRADYTNFTSSYALKNLNVPLFERFANRNNFINSNLRVAFFPVLNHATPGTNSYGIFKGSAIEALILKSPSITIANTGFLYDTPISIGIGYIYVPVDYVNTYKNTTNLTQLANQIVGYEFDQNVEIGDTFTPTITTNVVTWDNILVNEAAATTDSSTGVTEITGRGVFDDDYSSHVLVRGLDSNGVPVHCYLLHVK